MDRTDALDDRMETVARRVEYLDLLGEQGPLERRDVVDALPQSGSTVDRVLTELGDAGLVEKRGGRYDATLAGRMAADQYRQYRASSRAILSRREFLAAIPDPHAPPVEVLAGSDTVLTGESGPVGPLEAVAERVHHADVVRAYLPTLINTHLLRGWHRSVVHDGADAEVVFDPDLLSTLKGQYPGLLAEMAGTDEFSAFESTGPPYGVFLTTTGGSTTLSMVVYEDDAAVRGILTNDVPGAVEWARSELDLFVDDAPEVTDDLVEFGRVRPDGSVYSYTFDSADHSKAGPVDGASDQGLPLELESEGFVRLSGRYFDAQGEAPPAVSWRTGFTLPEVRAGHAVDRLDDEERNLTDRLVGALREGDDHVVLGPPGSGKSTVCMAVACEWYDRGLGPVLYRERGDGDRFESTAHLEATLRRTSPDDHALVVVEDAVREEASSVFEVMKALDGDPSVTFLLDTRTDEWDEPGTSGLDPRLDAYRRETVGRVVVPPIDERECERFVAHFADLVDADRGLSGPDLFELVEGGSGDHDPAASAGDALVVQHHLTRRHDLAVDPDARAPTALEASARKTYEEAVDADPDLAPDLAVLVALLTAAGVPVADEYLHAVAPDDEFDAVEETVSSLEGRLLFGKVRPRAGGPATYRTPHETWALRFLEGVLEASPTARARDRVGRCVTRLLALADDADRRDRIERRLGGRTPHLHQVEADPGGWADEVAERLFGVPRTDAALAPLFGETADDPIELPDACSGWTRLRQAYWRGKAYRVHGDPTRAEREFRTLGDLAGTVDLDGDPRDVPVPTDAGGPGDGTCDLAAHRTRWRAASRIGLGKVDNDRGEFENATEHHRAALALFRGIDDRSGVATTLHNLGAIVLEQGAYDEAREYIEESLPTLRETGDRRNVATGLNNLGLAAREQGAYDEANEHFEDALATFREIGYRRGEAHGLLNLGLVVRKRGAHDEAREHFEDALTVFREIGNQQGVAATLGNLGAVALVRGAYDEADEHFRESLAIERGIDDRRGEAQTLDNRGELAWRRGDHGEAREHLTESLDISREVGDRQGEGTSLLQLGTVARRRGEYDRAGDRLDRALAAFDAIGDREGAARVRHERGHLALARGEVGPAREHARAARDVFAELESTYRVAESRLLLGRIAIASDDPGAARDHLRSALETFEAIGAYPDALETLEELVELCDRRGDDGTVRELRQRALELLADAPEATAERYRDRVGGHATAS